MLVQFIVDNYLSFGSRQEFNLFVGKTRAHQGRVTQVQDKNILKFAALFGANASGKTNLIKAMAFMDYAIERGKLPKSCFQSYCRTHETNAKRNSYFETIIVINNIFYSYGFEAILSEGSFKSEWLIQLDMHGDEKPIFVRDLVSGKTEIEWALPAPSKQRFTMYADDLRNDQSTLLLSMMNTGKKELYKDFPDLALLGEVFKWYSNSFNASKPFEPITSGDRYLIDEKLEELASLLKKFDTDIQGIVKREIQNVDLLPHLNQALENAKQEIQHIFAKDDKVKELAMILRDADSFICFTQKRDEEDIKIKKLFFEHSDGQMYSIGEESDGTIRIMDLAEILLATEPKVFVIDELDRCLHPQLSYRFVQSVLAHLEKYPIQVIVTSHESRLLDLDLLRRDEIWFVEKRKSESILYSLEEFNERNDRKIDKAYLDGRYGGVPLFETLFPSEE